MFISVDGQKRPNVAAKGQTVGEVLDKVRESLAGSGRMIVGIVCDGQILDPEEITGVLKEHVDRYAEIDFQTAIPAELARTGLEASREFLADIEQTSVEVVDHLHQSQVQEARPKIADMFEKLGNAFRGLQGTFQLLGLDPESIELSSGDAKKFMLGLGGTLRQVRDALENQDYVAFADLLEYELAPALKEWQELIDHLLETLSAE
jgi:F420-dependent methylenetetrahydromethanopterin dehydrogenase